MTIKFNTVAEFQRSMAQALDDEAVTPQELGTLEPIVTARDVTLRTINASKLSTAQKAAAIFLKITYGLSNKDVLARRTKNLNEFFEHCMSHVDAHAALSAFHAEESIDRFADWDAIHVLCPNNSKVCLERDDETPTTRFTCRIPFRESVGFERLPDGTIDLGGAYFWTPATLDRAIQALERAAQPAEGSPLLALIRDSEPRQKLLRDTIEALRALNRTNPDTFDALQRLNAMAHKAPANAPLASQKVIDEIGKTLANVSDIQEPEGYTLSTENFLNDAYEAAMTITPDEEQAIAMVLQNLKEIGDPIPTGRMAYEAGLSERAFVLLNIFFLLRETAKNIGEFSNFFQSATSLRDAAHASLCNNKLNGDWLVNKANDPFRYKSDAKGGLSTFSGIFLGAIDEPSMKMKSENKCEVFLGTIRDSDDRPRDQKLILEKEHASFNNGDNKRYEDLDLTTLLDLADILLSLTSTSSNMLSYFRSKQDKGEGFSLYKLLEKINSEINARIDARIDQRQEIEAALGPLQGF